MQPHIPASKESKVRFFQRLEWKTDRVLLDELVFRLQHYRNDAWELGEECFVFYKTRPLVDQYARFLSTCPDFAPEQIFELGLWDGGSVAFWFELFQPRKHVAIDLADRDDSPYFRRYRASRELTDRIATHWRTNQADGERIRAIVSREFDHPLDLVIDDASHLYAPTKASFETLFPLMRPAGLYIIEDWAWAHWREFMSPTHPWASEVPLTALVCQLVELAGSSPALVGNVTVYEGFTVIERGPAKLEPQGFRIEDHIARRERPSMLMRARRRYWTMRTVAARFFGGKD